MGFRGGLQKWSPQHLPRDQRRLRTSISGPPPRMVQNQSRRGGVNPPIRGVQIWTAGVLNPPYKTSLQALTIRRPYLGGGPPPISEIRGGLQNGRPVACPLTRVSLRTSFVDLPPGWSKIKARRGGSTPRSGGSKFGPRASMFRGGSPPPFPRSGGVSKNGRLNTCRFVV